MYKLLLLIFLFSGALYDGYIRGHRDTTDTRVQVKTINQLHIEDLERQRAEREGKIKSVAAIIAKGNSAHTGKAEVYVDAAEKSGIPTWLLPSIGVLESTSCRYYPKSTNNCYGWGGTDLQSFPSIDMAIYYISDKLANGNYYKNKTIEQKVKTYNSESETYYQRLLAVAGEL